MKTRSDLIEGLKVEHVRLGRLLQVIDNGRWWTRESPDMADVAAIERQRLTIRTAIDDITDAVSHLGSSTR